eukprot:CAMPEP_0113957636 /NCGR_PEP_ID=MMETSP0011_2-20120614/2891_1 /TAXON_ID=101924 /ORGANISM="Rhodosorus marinus" /LENGTH=169 /DNA_ID=CAMNT_0000968243 /DNA_START=54 /DNA_END=564 /DNA_ORIENTATION=+ /assembly_acc=CAM_ASM_000156
MAFVSTFLGQSTSAWRSHNDNLSPSRMAMEPYQFGDERLTTKRQALEDAFKVTMVPDAQKGKTGTCTCIFCSGTGKRKCSWCKGHGVRQELKDLSWDQMNQMMNDIKSGKKSPSSLETEPVECPACKGTTMLNAATVKEPGPGAMDSLTEFENRLAPVRRTLLLRTGGR